MQLDRDNNKENANKGCPTQLKDIRAEKTAELIYDMLGDVCFPMLQIIMDRR